jgi:hypothetical protein
MVEIFKTNVQLSAEAEQLVSHLSGLMPGCLINLDLHDCDKVLRVQGEQVIPEQVVSITRAMGYDCMILD